jgi:hypothetical protein
MNGNALNGNVCSVIPETGGWHMLLEYSFPTFTSRKQSPLHFLKALKEYFKVKSADERLQLNLVSKSLIEEFVKNWFVATKEHIDRYEEFKTKC